MRRLLLVLSVAMMMVAVAAPAFASNGGPPIDPPHAKQAVAACDGFTASDGAAPFKCRHHH